MHTSNTLLTLALLSLSSAQQIPAPQDATTTSTVAVTQTTSTSTTAPASSALTPEQQFDRDYAALLAAESKNPQFAAIQTAAAAGDVPREEANQQVQSFLSAIKVSPTQVPQPAWIAALPQDQQAYWRNFHAQLASIARADFGIGSAAPTGGANGTMLNGTAPAGGNGTPIATQLSTTAQPPLQSPTQAGEPAGNATEGEDEPAMAASIRPGSLASMAAAGLVGVLGVALFL
ncbi:MAG: hypothetical protein Q9174_004466 [Haloplaca sp. 1 TL-2023]